MYKMSKKIGQFLRRMRQKYHQLKEESVGTGNLKKNNKLIIA
jgi:hypothetical protein